MTDDVLVPPGVPILEAAAWVGHACWGELALHRVLTGWLADEDDGEAVVAFWAARAHAAERAEAWHRRLPELREFPRAGFVRGSEEGEGGAAALAALAGPGRSGERRAALDAALARMAAHYQDHLAVAVGPADGPTAETLRRSLASVAADRGGSAARP